MHWNNKDNRRALFAQFARARNFDPLVAKQWLPYLEVDPKVQQLKIFLKISKFEKSLLFALEQRFLLGTRIKLGTPLSHTF
jgi:hypothetical protein